MARLWSSGLELQSVNLEFDSNVNSPPIDTTIKRSGVASLRSNPSASTKHATYQFAASSPPSGVDYYIRFYIYTATRPASTVYIMQAMRTSTGRVGIKMTSTGTLSLWDDSPGAAIGSPSVVVPLNEWHMVEMFIDITGSNIAGVTAKLDGVQFASGTASSQTTPHQIRMGVAETATADIYYDDIAINDNQGSSQTGYPGAGSILHMRPDAAGDNTQWQDDASVVQGTSIVDNINEAIPDDSVNYNKRTLNAPTTTPIDDWTVESAAGAGLPGGSTISLVQVGVRAGAISITSTGRSIKARIKSASGGTTTSSASTGVNVNGWTTNQIAVPKNYILTSYTDPTTGVAWTPTGTNSLDNMQIGYQADVSSINEIRVTGIWALVEYIPPPSGIPRHGFVNYQGPGVL